MNENKKLRSHQNSQYHESEVFKRMPFEKHSCLVMCVCPVMRFRASHCQICQTKYILQNF